MARNDDGFDDEDRDVGYADAYEESDEDEYREGDQRAVSDDRPDSEYAAYGDESESSWTGIALALVAVGAVLFLFPEPLTSSLGILLVVAGVGLAVVDLLT